jgi:hypothetical protein
MNFKDILKNDITSVFLNDLEFADKHNIDGVDMLCIIDNSELEERKKLYTHYMDGIFEGKTLIYVRAADMGVLPGVSKRLYLDNEPYTVEEAMDECGIYSIVLEAIFSD